MGSICLCDYSTPSNRDMCIKEHFLTLNGTIIRNGSKRDPNGSIVDQNELWFTENLVAFSKTKHENRTKMDKK